MALDTIDIGALTVLDESILDDVVTCTAHQPHDCSVTATHRAFVTCGGAEPRFWCANRHRLYTEKSGTCVFCHQPVQECWIVRVL